MELNTIQMTAKIPSSFGMPACGHAFETTPAIGVLGTTTTTVVRERQGNQAIVKGDMGLAVAYFPGTSAWRPPTS